MAETHRIDAIEQEILQLKPNARVKLAHSLVNSLENLSETELEQIWLQEAHRRAAELDSGTVESIPGDEVFERLKKRYGA